VVSYEPASFRSFGAGLNLRDKSDAVSEEECIDALNVLFTERGAVKQRDGYTNFTSSTLTNRVASLEPFYTSSGTKQLVAGCGTRLEALNTSGAVVASLTGLTDGTWDFARFGAPGSEYIYAGNGSQANLRRWDGASWSEVLNTPDAGALAVMAVDQGNRLVAGRFNTTTGGPTGGAATSNPSRVYFSGAGAPETWATNDYVDFAPGDGEAIQAIVAWREFIIVFKETKFFIVYGTTVDATGSPVFNWRTVDAGVGLVSPRAVCATEEGVYFMDRRGVYRTTGGEPERLSSAIDPIFLGGASSFYLGGGLAHASITNSAMWAHDRRIYLGITTGSANDRVLVYDPRFEWWSLYDIPASCGTSFRISNQAEMVFGYASGLNDIGRHSSAYTSDAGAAITSRWRSGWFDYDLPTVKTIRETKVWGSGKVSLAVSHDFRIAVGDSLTLLDLTSNPSGSLFGGTGTFGGTGIFGDTASGLSPALRRYGVRGTVFSTYLSNSTLDQAWAVHRLTHHLREARIPSVKTATAA
jgi:hypothetical protein